MMDDDDVTDADADADADVTDDEGDDLVAKSGHFSPRHLRVGSSRTTLGNFIIIITIILIIIIITPLSIIIIRGSGSRITLKLLLQLPS